MKIEIAKDSIIEIFVSIVDENGIMIKCNINPINVFCSEDKNTLNFIIQPLTK